MLILQDPRIWFWMRLPLICKVQTENKGEGPAVAGGWVIEREATNSPKFWTAQN